MQYTFTNLSDLSADALFVWIRSDEDYNYKNLGLKVDIDILAKNEAFKGKAGEEFILRGAVNPASTLVLIGVGNTRDLKKGSARIAAVQAIRIAKKIRTKTIALAELNGYENELIEGIGLGHYHFDNYLTKKEDAFEGVENVQILFAKSTDIQTPQIIADGVNYARTLVNLAPNDLYPASLAESAKEIAKFGGLECTILEEKELEAKGFNLIMAVGKGSIHQPRLIHLTYKSEGDIDHVIGFVGKGVTFDTGGYNIKTGASMMNMHCDMAGAAAVLGAAKAIAQLRPKGVEVHFIVPSAENAIANNAFKPNDIFQGYGGKTVEIHNTDAEGRLILADGLAYAQEQGVETLLDLATLTGAAVVALGEHTTGVFSNDDDLVANILNASVASGEDMWRMPLTERLDKLLDSPFADMKNLGPRWGGAITAALFLKRWVNLDAWAHLDIAGPAFTESEDPLGPKGGTGHAVATLVRFVQNLSS